MVQVLLLLFMMEKSIDFLIVFQQNTEIKNDDNVVMLSQ